MNEDDLKSLTFYVEALNDLLKKPEATKEWRAKVQHYVRKIADYEEG